MGIGFGELELTPAEFASFSPRELQWRIEGYKRRDDRARYHVATLAAWVLGSLAGKALTADKLIGPTGSSALPTPPVPKDEDD